ncbi:MAG TPA: hypothetical protein VMF91_23250 [Bryobacteraceae bacterium]|nr:hypothetical protein [Bryobacteraceae bacterium]
MRRSVFKPRSSLLLAWSSAVLYFFLGGPSQLAADPIYSVVNLGALGAGAAMPTAINNSGSAVGFVTNPSGYQVPVTFNGQPNSLAGDGQASGVNDAGTVVGTQLTNNNPNVTEWSNGQAQSLSVPGYGTAINNSGEVAGGYTTANGQLHAFTWSNGTLTDLGTLPGGTWSAAYALNSSGQIAGTSSIGNGLFSAFFSNGSALTPIGTFAGANGSSYGTAINDYGEIVGSAQNAQGFANAFVWTGGSPVDIGTLGGTQSYAYGVNDAGTVVGYSLMSDNSSHAFVYSNGIMFDVNNLLPIGSGWSIEEAFAINASGDILASGTFGNESYAVELLPASVVTDSDDALATPEPASLPLAIAGLILLCLAGRLRRNLRRL